MDVINVSRRRSGFGAFNPLADSEHNPDTWICVSEHGIQFYRTAALHGEPEKVVPIGAHVEATKEGDCLQEKSTGLYAAFKDSEGNRNFKNQRLMLLEKSSHCGEPLSRASSKGSAGSTMSGGRRSNASDFSGGGGGGGGPQPSLSKKMSFRWVDSTGEAHRVEGCSDMVKELDEHPEVWLCIADRDVQYYSSKSFTDIINNRECKVGTKVNGIKEDDWLRVFEVRSSFDAPASIGRRSFKAATRISVEDTGLYLPFSENGQKLFKSNKLALFQESGKMTIEELGAKKDDGGCSVM